jgi:capsid assembly protease
MLHLPYVASRVFGTPLMIARAKLEVILGVLTPRLIGSTPEPTDVKAHPAPLSSITVEKIAVISVIGTLVSRSGYLDAASGLQSYGEIGDAVSDAMNDPTVRGIILDVDSPGGEVGGLFDLVEQLQAVRSIGAKPLWAVANESALSAAYAIASATQRLYVTRTGEVGSIGVVAVHVDESGADSKAGLAWTFVFAGERKIDGNAHEPLSARARTTIQDDVNRLYGELCPLVATNRGLSTAAVRATDAAIYRGDLALRAGLADRVGTLDLAIAEMAAEIDRAAPLTRTSNPSSRRSPSMSTDETGRIQRDPNESTVVSETAALVSPPPNPEPNSTGSIRSGTARRRLS